MKKLPLLKIELAQEMDAVRQLNKIIQEDLSSHKRYVSGLANDFNNRKRGEEHVYKEIDDLRKLVEENKMLALQKAEFIGIKSVIEESLLGKAEI